MKSKIRFKDAPPPGFTNPIALPANELEHDAWQQQNRNWWQRHSMRYDWNSAIPYPEFSREFYEEIDRRFFSTVESYAPWKKIPFDTFLDFESLRSKDVLEIGCGNGSHAQLLAGHARSYTGIDLTEYAVNSTSTRLSLFGLNGKVMQMDAERMRFPDASFDFVWSWGVIHHSANTANILKEMKRVLKPGGRAMIMVYYRGFWNYYATGAIVAAMSGKLPSPAAIHEGKQLTTDGGLARYYGSSDWRKTVKGLFNVDSIRIYGQKEALVLLPGSRLKTAILKAIPNALGRFMSNRCRMGNFLVAEMVRA